MSVVHLPPLNVTDGDLVTQVQRLYDLAAEQLGSYGLTTSNIVKTVDFITPAAVPAYKLTGRIRKERLGPVYPAAAGIVMPRLEDPGSLIQLEITASCYALSAVNPGWSRYAKLTYSPAVRAGSMLFLSGQAALDPETERAVHAGDVGEQAAYTYANIGRVLEAADATPANIVEIVEYVTPAGMAGFADAEAARERFLGGRSVPTRVVPCHSLLRPEFEIEVEPLAVL